MLSFGGRAEARPPPYNHRADLCDLKLKGPILLAKLSLITLFATKESSALCTFNFYPEMQAAVCICCLLAARVTFNNLHFFCFIFIVHLQGIPLRHLCNLTRRHSNLSVLAGLDQQRYDLLQRISILLRQGLTNLDSWNARDEWDLGILPCE